jgi:uncharacterized membrane protein YdjX (TVP38/TMEM64 family)
MTDAPAETKVAVPARVWLRGVLFFVSLAALGLALKFTGIGEVLSEDWVDIHVRGAGIAGEAAFLAVAALAAAIGLPRQIVSFLAGYAFGLVAGTAFALGATVLGCMMTFYYARFLGRDLVLAKASGRIRQADRFLGDNTFTMALLIRLLPAGSNLVTSLAAGVSSARGLPFFAGSGLGYVPQTVVFALFGSGLQIQPELRISLSVVLFAASAALGIYLYRKFRKGREFADAAE